MACAAHHAFASRPFMRNAAELVSCSRDSRFRATAHHSSHQKGSGFWLNLYHSDPECLARGPGAAHVVEPFGVDRLAQVRQLLPGIRDYLAQPPCVRMPVMRARRAWHQHDWRGMVFWTSRAGQHSTARQPWIAASMILMRFMSEAGQVARETGGREG